MFWVLQHGWVISAQRYWCWQVPRILLFTSTKWYIVIHVKLERYCDHDNNQPWLSDKLLSLRTIWFVYFCHCQKKKLEFGYMLFFSVKMRSHLPVFISLVKSSLVYVIRNFVSKYLGMNLQWVTVSTKWKAAWFDIDTSCASYTHLLVHYW